MRDIQMRIKARTMAFDAVIVRVGNRPCHIGDGVQKRAIDGHCLFQQILKIIRLRRQSVLPTTELIPQGLNDGNQSFRINALVEIRKRTPADFVNREVPLCMWRLAEILNGSQRANGGIEEREQVDNEDIIEKEFLISVSVLVLQGS